MNRLRSTLLLALICCCSWPASADTITLADGSRLIGKVERMQDGKLTLATEFAGTLEIDAAAIQSIAIDESVNVQMDTGDRLVGPMEWKPTVEVAMVNTEMGGIPVKVKRIDSIWMVGQKSPDVLAMEAQIAEKEAELEAAQPKWGGTFEVGLLFKEGNTEKLEARAKVELRRKTNKDLLKFYASAQYAEENKRRDTHEVKAGMYYEYLLTERFFTFGRADIEYDEFENIDLRFSMAFGGGYYWIKAPDHELKTRLGVGYLHETYSTGLTRDTGQLDLGLEYRKDIAPWLQFTHATTYYPTFDSLRDYRLVSDTGLLIPLGDSKIWKLKLGALYEYKSIPSLGSEALDQTYYANILLEW